VDEPATDPLDELLRSLTKVARTRFAPDQGLFAALFVADALRSGGLDASELRLITSQLELRRELAPPTLEKSWAKRYGDRPATSFTHQLLAVGERFVDPLIGALRSGEDGLYRGALPSFYGPWKARPIYRD
jgi:hypothetical protein